MRVLHPLCFLYLLGLAVADYQAKNLALYGKATQSDLIENPWSGYSDAYNAIDGNADPHFHHGSCTATDEQANPWWRVDLLSQYIITLVVITNRGDCCPERLNGAEIHIGNSLLDNGNRNPLAQVISAIPAGGSMNFTWKDGFEGRYVNILLPGEKKLLTVCEVEVYGHLKTDGQNVALRGKATQSGLYEFGYAFNAINGDRNSFWTHRSCSHTDGSQVSPWWRVDLLRKYKVSSVVIINMMEAHTRIQGAEIRIGNSLDNNGNKNPRCDVIPLMSPGASMTFQCNGMEGRYVNVVIPERREFLHLCEVEVYGSALA